jgi:hypothetical protein
LDAQNISPLDIQGPITRARARQLNLEVSSFLSTSTYDFQNRLLPNDYIVIRAKERTRRCMEKGLEAWRYSKGVQAKLETQFKSTSTPPRSPGAVCFKLDAQVIYRVRFERSIYGWN